MKGGRGQKYPKYDHVVMDAPLLVKRFGVRVETI